MSPSLGRMVLLSWTAREEKGTEAGSRSFFGGRGAFGEPSAHEQAFVSLISHLFLLTKFRSSLCLTWVQPEPAPPLLLGFQYAHWQRGGLDKVALLVKSSG